VIGGVAETAHSAPKVVGDYDDNHPMISVGDRWLRFFRQAGSSASALSLVSTRFDRADPVVIS
jgi:hypothetical protein